MALIAAFHEVYGHRLVPESRVRLHPDEWSTYDPDEDNVPEVLAYLAMANRAERERVFALERAGKNRVTVLAEEARLLGEDEVLDDTSHHQTPDAVGAGDHNQEV
jgi:hypothetical protein